MTDTDGKKELKNIQFKITQEHKERFAILQALARYSNGSDYLMDLIDKTYERQMAQDKTEGGDK